MLEQNDFRFSMMMNLIKETAKTYYCLTVKEDHDNKRLYMEVPIFVEDNHIKELKKLISENIGYKLMTKRVGKETLLKSKDRTENVKSFSKYLWNMTSDLDCNIDPTDPKLIVIETTRENKQSNVDKVIAWHDVFGLKTTVEYVDQVYNPNKLSKEQKKQDDIIRTCLKMFEEDFNVKLKNFDTELGNLTLEVPEQMSDSSVLLFRRYFMKALTLNNVFIKRVNKPLKKEMTEDLVRGLDI